MSVNILEDLLFLENKGPLALSKYISPLSLRYLGVFFILGVILEFMGEWAFSSVLKRTILAAIIISSSSYIITPSIKRSFSYSNQLIKRFDPQNKLISSWKKSSRTLHRYKKKGSDKSWLRLQILGKAVIEDTISFVSWILVYVALWILKYLYSTVYYFLLVFIGPCALLSILPFTQKAINGVIQTYLWLVLMPPVVSLLVLLLGSVDQFNPAMSGALTTNFTGLLHLLIMSIFLLLSPVITSSIISGVGLYEFSTALGKSYANASLFGLQNMIIKSATTPALKTLNMGKRGYGSFARDLSQRATGIKQNLGADFNRPQAISENTGSIQERLSAKKERFDNLRKNATPKEKAVLALDKVLNGPKNHAKAVNIKKSALQVPKSVESKTHLQQQRQEIFQNKPLRVKAQTAIKEINKGGFNPSNYTKKELSAADVISRSARSGQKEDFIINPQNHKKLTEITPKHRTKRGIRPKK